jgi:hypothetical protein
MTLTFNPKIYGSLLVEVLPQQIAHESEYQIVLAIVESLMPLEHQYRRRADA